VRGERRPSGGHTEGQVLSDVNGMVSSGHQFNQVQELTRRDQGVPGNDRKGEQALGLGSEEMISFSKPFPVSPAEECGARDVGQLLSGAAGTLRVSSFSPFLVLEKRLCWPLTSCGLSVTWKTLLVPK
jgi:hypothetical protein